MPNFSFLGGLEVAEKFMVVDGLAVTTMSNLNQSCIELELGLGITNFKAYCRHEKRCRRTDASLDKSLLG